MKKNILKLIFIFLILLILIQIIYFSFFWQKTIQNAQEKEILIEKIKENLHACDFPWNTYNSHTINLNYKEFNGLCIIKNKSFYTQYKEINDEMQSILGTNANAILFKSKFENGKLVDFEIYHKFDTTREKNECFLDFKNSGRLKINAICD